MNYRLVYENGIILSVCENIGTTVGPASVFNGTADQIKEHVTSLGLQDPNDCLSILN